MKTSMDNYSRGFYSRRDAEILRALGLTLSRDAQRVARPASAPERPPAPVQLVIAWGDQPAWRPQNRRAA